MRLFRRKEQRNGAGAGDSSGSQEYNDSSAASSTHSVASSSAYSPDASASSISQNSVTSITSAAATYDAAVLEQLKKPRLITHVGIPKFSSLARDINGDQQTLNDTNNDNNACCNALAYSHTQRLLALATGDGRVKVFGTPGVERLFSSRDSNLCTNKDDSMHQMDMDNPETKDKSDKQNLGMISSLPRHRPKLMFWEDQGVLLHVRQLLDGSARIEVIDLRLQRRVAEARLGYTVTAIHVVNGVTVREDKTDCQDSANAHHEIEDVNMVTIDNSSLLRTQSGLPFVFVGDDFGSVHVLRMSRQLQTLTEMPYRFDKDTLDDIISNASNDGKVIPSNAMELMKQAQVYRSENIDDEQIVAITSQPKAELTRIVISYASGISYLWSLVDRTIVSAFFTSNTEAPLGKLTAIVWIGERGEHFATGHDTGGIALFSVPEACKPMYECPKRIFAVSKPSRILCQPILDSTISSVTPITHLYYSSKELRTDGIPSSTQILVYKGGKSIDEPSTINIIRFQNDDVQTSDHGEKEAENINMQSSNQNFPFFGAIEDMLPVPSPGAAIQSIITLVEGNTVQVHPLSSPFQNPMQMTPVLSASIVTVLSLFDGKENFCNNGSEYTDTSWYGSLGSVAMTPDIPKCPSCDIASVKWPAQGGDIGFDADSLGGPILLSGHVDGKVRLWACSSPGSPLLTETQSSAQGQDSPDEIDAKDPGPVTCIDACCLSGLLAVGHENGDVRLWMYSTNPRKIAMKTIRATTQTTDKEDVLVKYRLCDPGFALILRSYTASSSNAKIMCICLSTTYGILVACDANGQVMVIDIKNGRMRAVIAPFSTMVPTSSTPECRMSGKVCVVFPTKSCHQRLQKSNSTSAQAVYVPIACIAIVSTDSSMALVYSSESETYALSTIRPKKKSMAVALHCLSSDNKSTVSSSHSKCKLKIDWIFSEASTENVVNGELYDSHDIEESKDSAMRNESCSERQDNSLDDSDGPGLEGQVIEQPTSDNLGDENLVQNSDALSSTTEQCSEGDHEERNDNSSVTSEVFIGEVSNSADSNGSNPPDTAAEEQLPGSSTTDTDFQSDSPAVLDQDSVQRCSLPAPQPQLEADTVITSTVILVSSEHARVYSVDSLMRSERTHLYKINFAEAGGPASCVLMSSLHKAADHEVMICLTLKREVIVYGLPSLRPIKKISLSEIVGWNLSRYPFGTENSNSAENLAFTASFSERGNVIFTETTNTEPSSDYSLLSLFTKKKDKMSYRLDVDGGEDTLSDFPNSDYSDNESDDDLEDFRCYIFDQDVQNASTMARIAIEEQEKQQSESSKKPRGGKMASVFSNAQRGMARLMSGRDSRSSDEELVKCKSIPTKNVLERLLSSQKVSAPSSEEDVVKPLKPVKPVKPLSPSIHNESADREALFGTNEPPPTSQSPQRRSVDDIKAAYGRKTGSVQQTMAENRNKLLERGEKLEQLQDKTAKLENDAMNFAQMARELRKQQEQRKWWEL